MTRNVVVSLVLAVLGAAALGYWVGQRRDAAPAATATEHAQMSQGSSSNRRRILYYRHPMGVDTSPVPKKDQMGMDYVPVYEGEEAQGPLVQISPERVQTLGVTTEEVARRQIQRTVRAVGTVQADERRLYAISPRFEGWAKKLLVNTTGAAVRVGQPLMEVYSPDLITAQQEYAIAWKGLKDVANAPPEIRRNMEVLAQGSLERLRNWDISEPEIRRLQAGEPVGQTLLVRSPIDGIVLEKMVVEGMRFMPGETLYRLADLRSVWVLAEVFEQDLGLIRVGQSARIEVSAYPDQSFEGKVAFIYPTVMRETRTARVRVELPNRDGRLKPDMFGTVMLEVLGEEPAPVTVANGAVLDSGTRRLVLVERGAGRYEPRDVQLGRRGDDYAEVLDGLVEGERVVTSANFLIDAESNLKSALGAFGAHGHGGGAPSAGGEPRESPKGDRASKENPPQPQPSQHDGRH